MLLKAKIANFKMPGKLQHSQKIKNDKKYLKSITSTWISKNIHIQKKKTQKPKTTTLQTLTSPLPFYQKTKQPISKIPQQINFLYNSSNLIQRSS